MLDGPKELSEKDRKQLARLVGKYGRTTLVAAVRRIRPPSRGRRRGSFQQELYELADEIERRTQDHKEAGQARPQYRATSDLFLKTFPRDQQTAENRATFAGRVKKAL